MMLFSVLISFSIVNVAGAHLINPSIPYGNESMHSAVINDNDSSDSDLETMILARSDKSKKSKKSEKSLKSEKSNKSEKNKERGESEGKGKGKKKGHSK